MNTGSTYSSSIYDEYIPWSCTSNTTNSYTASSWIQGYEMPKPDIDVLERRISDLEEYTKYLEQKLNTLIDANDAFRLLFDE